MLNKCKHKEKPLFYKIELKTKDYKMSEKELINIIRWKPNKWKEKLIGPMIKFKLIKMKDDKWFKFTFFNRFINYEENKF